MKKRTRQFLAPISSELMQSLFIEVRETIAGEAVMEVPKKFTTADLWRIHRQARQFIQRRYVL